MRLVENTVVAGRFRLNRPLGAGGMGAVWHATHLGLDIPCAIKFVKGELADQEDMRARFEREAKAAAQLRSPHVVQVLDHGICEGTPYIAMELLDGEDLGTRLARMGRLPPEAICKVVSEACRALTKAHANGIVHRDLKPDNIFLVRDDEREITKVLDFGIAKSVKNEVSGSGTKTGAMLGTPYYMSPEQAQGIKAVDFRSDLWSLAVITFQCLTGSLPFQSEALGDLLVKIIIHPIPVPSLLAPVPAGFDVWWAKAAARDPAERFQSAREFSDALALVCGVSYGSGVDRSPFPSEAPGLTARQRLTSALGDAPVQAASATTAGITPTPVSRSFMPEPIGPPSRGGIVAAFALGGALFACTLAGAGWLALHGRGVGRAAATASASAPAALAGASASPSMPPPTVATSLATSAEDAGTPPPDEGSPSANSTASAPSASAVPPTAGSRARPKSVTAGGPAKSIPKSAKTVDMGF
jgi:serine/threonine-protein kinase